MFVDRALKKFIQRWVFYNRPLQAFTWWKYYTPDAKRPQVPLTPHGTDRLNELIEEGITFLPARFVDVADHIERTYFSAIDGRPEEKSGALEMLDIGEREEATGSCSYRVSFKDPGLAPLVFDQDVCGILYNYYRRQPFYRQQPWVIRNAMKREIGGQEMSRLEVSSKYHIDYYRQITCQLFVNDLSVDDTHLQYASGSHKSKDHPWNRYKYTDEEIEKRYRIVDAVGPKGTLVIMDAGCGFHRGLHKTGTVRKTFQTVLTTGHYFCDEPKVSAADWRDLGAKPDYIRRMMDKLITR